ncbi:M48 family metalloprotease [Jejuia spongiicola]|uniref:M48 family metalloprotease n=1 Tax=Jejuia spongiicola TaxID=2942207 RepID=A0ABT0QHY5_9FLAO|nr:M48 family metalloprotease [Jejuia spongiicola]MCL6295555.1 M48 family metalloprotease [Jejuia spongiicola]
MKISCKKLSVFIFLCSINFINGQEVLTQYIPNNLDSLKTYLKQINSKHIKKINGEFSSKIKKVYKNRDEKVLESIEDSTYVFNPEINKNLGLILQHIYKSNPDIDSKDFYFFIKNSIVPNAACYGDGMFEINLGLFTKLESEDELTFVICHEIAHKLLNHSLKNVSKSIALINSKQTKKKVRDIKKNKYGQTRAALSVIDELNIDMLDYSKEVEAEADSLGFILFSKTKYEKFRALSSLEKLKKVDEMILHHDVKLDSVFNFKNYPFQPYWLKETTSLFDTNKEINEFSLLSDTLKTHPEIEFRVEKLIKSFNIERKEVDFKKSKDLFFDIKQISHLQSIQFTLDLKLFDVTIYQLIEKYNNKKIDEDYYYTKMIEALQCIYQAKKNHELGKHVPLKNSFSDEKQLNKIRLFLHNLELNEVKKMGLAFCDLIESKKINYPNLNEIIEFFKSINN